MLLGHVFKNINQKYKSIKFKKIRFHSKECRPNDIFFSISGNNINGNNYINEAISNGAKIIVSNLNFNGFDKNKILFVQNNNPRKLLAEIASNYYKKKPKNIIAVTGTNGKTSIANFYYQILNLNNKKVAAIGTLGIFSKKINLKTNNTTIDPLSLHKLLKKLKDFGVENVILEASSHGLKQHRLNNIKFNTAIFTNLSRDHLDYHRTFKDYLNSKLILFNKLLSYKGNIVFDNEISQSNKLNKILETRKLNKYDLGKKKSFINILRIKKINDTKKVDLSINNKKYSFTTTLVGNIQIKNLLFAILAAYLSKIKINDILKSVGKIKPINGRLEKIGNIKNNSKVILDYAHTPDALKTAILNVKEDYPLSKISLVFGCGGNRDTEKRSLMGNIASKLCDRIYLTDDNPRFENPNLIRNQIKKGMKNNFFEIPSRSKAINLAVQELKSGDILIVGGKGHESFQEYKKKKFFSDRLEIKKAINIKNSNLSKSIKTNILKEDLGINFLNKKTYINSASINSKKIKKNSIFIGIKGKKFDGNLYSNEAIKNNAILAISNKKYKSTKIINQKNPLLAFNKITASYRKSLDANYIAITGSSGKTSLKELTGFCLSKLTKTYLSKNSYNNKYGVPLSIFNAPQNTKFNVLEVGMNKKGEIDNLTKLIKPNLGLITNISYAHIENFKNLNEISKAKSEIINNIIPGGTMILNKDDKFYKYFLRKAKKRKLKIISFSKNDKEADVTFLNEKKNKDKNLLKFKLKNTIKYFIISKDLSKYKENILASLSIIINYFDINKINKNIFVNFSIPKSRGSIIKYKRGSKKLTIVDESYNSNPLSFKFALERFDSTYKEKKKKFLLVGNMLELGKFSKDLHNEIAKYINKSKINKTYVFGKLTKHTFNKLKPQIRGKVLNNNMDILNLIKKELPNNSFLMVKGSNSTGLNNIIRNL